MTDRIEKAYLLKEEELAVLLTIKGAQRLYGFRMGAGADMGKDKLHRILFEMTRKNILSISGGRIQMDSRLEAGLDDMVKAASVLILTGKTEYPECCIYAGQNMVFVHLLGQSGKIYHIEPVKRKEASTKMREYGWLIPGVLDRTQTDREEGEHHQQMQELAGLLYGQEKESILQYEEVRCCLMQYELGKIRKTRQLLLISGVLEDYITVSDGEQDEVYLYSDGKSEELLLELIGGVL